MKTVNFIRFFAFAAILVLGSCGQKASTVQAQTAPEVKEDNTKSKQADKPAYRKEDISFINSYSGLVYDEIMHLDQAMVDRRIKKLLGDDYQAALFPIKQGQQKFFMADDFWLMIYGEATYPGGKDHAAICIDIPNNSICVGLSENGEEPPRVWTEDKSVQPPPFLQWVQDSH